MHSIAKNRDEESKKYADHKKLCLIHQKYIFKLCQGDFRFIHTCIVCHQVSEQLLNLYKKSKRNELENIVLFNAHLQFRVVTWGTITFHSKINFFNKAAIVITRLVFC